MKEYTVTNSEVEKDIYLTPLHVQKTGSGDFLTWGVQRLHEWSTSQLMSCRTQRIQHKQPLRHIHMLSEQVAYGGLGRGLRGQRHDCCERSEAALVGMHGAGGGVLIAGPLGWVAEN